MGQIGQAQTVWDSVRGVGIRLIDFLPSFAGAIVTLVIGIVLAKIVGRLVERSSRAIGFDRIIDGTALGHYVARVGPPWSGSYLLGALTMWFLTLVTLQAAVSVLALPEISELLTRFIAFIPNLTVACLIVVLGAVGGRVVGRGARALAVSRGSPTPERSDRIASVAVGALALFAALSQLGIAPVIVNTIFIGMVGAFALAVGLAFGLGGRGVAADITQRWSERGHRIVTSGEISEKSTGAHSGEAH